ncbi:serine hydrolase domain-containing protein [Wukongibacter baidiensis]|uniref:serine hydrolase domain-containing protein n=1 Tax=Wukongibacter baidiensis TaxID=1723361 RepID=UPI003D7F4BF7
MLKKSYGYAKYSPDKTMMETDTIFDIASLTKIFTLTAILRLASEKELKLSDKISRYLQFDNDGLNNTIKDITIQQLLSHSSGLIPWFPFYVMEDRSFEEILEHVISENPLKNEAVQYSDINFILLGKLIEKINGKSLDSALRELVFNPLGLKDTGFRPLRDKIAATEYGNIIETKMVADRGLRFEGFRDEHIPIVGKVNDGNCYYYFKGVAGHAGIFSSLNDLNILCNLYLNRGSLGGKPIIREEIINQSFIDYGEGRGLGWQISELYPDGLGHTGFTGTSIYLNLKEGFNVVLLTNRLHVDKPVNIAEFRSAIHNKVMKNLKGEC